MPMLFLSPSTQEYNMYYDGSGSEEYYMNLIADMMEPYLSASGITYGRNNPAGTVGDSVRLSNAGNYSLHLAIHSNASGSANYGGQTGSDVYYYPTSANGLRAAEIIVRNLKTIYPQPEKVRAVATTRLYELNNSRAPAVLVELAYHDNASDAEWIKSNLPQIARNLSLSVAEYFGLALAEPSAVPNATARHPGRVAEYPRSSGYKRRYTRPDTQRREDYRKRAAGRMVSCQLQRNKRLQLRRIHSV